MPKPKKDVVTRIAYGANLTEKKITILSQMASLLGWIRQETWQRYGSFKGSQREPRDIRDEDWMRGEKLGSKTQLPASGSKVDPFWVKTG